MSGQSGSTNLLFGIMPAVSVFEALVIIGMGMDRIEDTADRMRSDVRAKTSAVVGFVRGLHVAIEWMLRSRHQGVRNVNLEEATWQMDAIVPTTRKAAAVS